MAPYTLITGSSNGLGYHLARTFAREGHNIIVHGRNSDALERIVAEIRAAGRECCSVEGDITRPETRDAILKLVTEYNVETLVNNAGIHRACAVQDMKESDLRAVMEANFFAPALLMTRVLPYFVNRGSGTIVNINSVAGKHGTSGEAAYAASKHALRGYSAAAKTEVVPRGIRIIDVFPNAIATDMTRERKNFPYFMKPEEVAAFIVNVCASATSTYLSDVDIERRIFPKS